MKFPTLFSVTPILFVLVSALGIMQAALVDGDQRMVMLSPSPWKRAAIGSRANGAACHIRADKGSFDEDSLRIPK